MCRDDETLGRLESAAFDYFLLCANPENGLIADTTRPGSPSSIACVGFGLSAYLAGVERGWMTRAAAADRTLKTMRFFCHGPADGGFAAIGHRGFCYHFLDMMTGQRAWNCELSFIDTALLLAGMLAAGSYFDGSDAAESEIRDLVDHFYCRVDWGWALNSGKTIALAWKPKSGFMRQRWSGYNEGLILYILGLASPTFPLCCEDYLAWCASYDWRTFYDTPVLYGAPLFVHHFSHAWIDFRGIRDAAMTHVSSDYFENTRRTVAIQRRYATDNPRGFAGYGADCWGLSAGDGPWGQYVPGAARRYRGLGYAARGVPEGPDDGTLMPSAMISCLPFAPDETLGALAYLRKTYPDVVPNDHVPSGYNPSLARDGKIWISDGLYGLDQGIMLMMIENHRTEMFWRLMRGNAHIVRGLQKAGFTGGWLAS